MYELKEDVDFVSIVRERMQEKGWNEKNLAEEIGRPCSSVYGFFSKKNKSRFLAAEIALALGIEEGDL